MKGKAIYKKIINAIVKQASEIIGPVAIVQANNVKGLRVTAMGDVDIKGDPVKKVEQLIKAYEIIIGPVALTIAKRGIKQLLEKNPKAKVPKMLR